MSVKTAASNGYKNELNNVNGAKAYLPVSAVETVSAVPYQSLVETIDLNYASEVAKIPVDLSAAPQDTDPIAMRRWYKEAGAKLPRAPESRRFRPEVNVEHSDHVVKYGAGNEYNIRVHAAKVDPGEVAEPRPAVVFYHGGGWIHGDLDGDAQVCDYFASEIRGVVFNVDYRLAPENPYPAPFDDCYHAISWAHERANEYNVDVTRIALWGCSAGGNLAACVALRDVAEHKPSRLRHIHLVVPVTCHPDHYPAVLSGKLASLSKEEQGFIQKYKQLWLMYAPDTSSHISPYASPLLASPPPSHHPSVFITTAGTDYLRDEGIAYAQFLRSADIDTQLEIIPGVPHNLTMAPSANVARQFFMDQVRAFNAALCPSR